MSETAVIPKHPAKFSDSILEALASVLADELRVKGHELEILDPMAGSGRIHELRTDTINTFGVELEQEWADQHPDTFQGDATNLWYQDCSFDAVITSPAYGNRMADHHNARDGSDRMTYKHKLGRDLSPNSGAGLQWGGAYRELHERILGEMIRVTKPGGLIVVNVSNHIRKRVEEPVSEWWLGRMVIRGLRVVSVIPVETPRMGFGQNADARTECEWVFVTRKP